MTDSEMNRRDRPATLGDLDDAFAKLATKEEIAKLATKEDLAKVPTREEMRLEIASALDFFAQRFADMLQRSHRELSEDLTRRLRAVSEENRAFMRAIDDRYRDLPERVSALEKKVFEPG